MHARAPTPGQSGDALIGALPRVLAALAIIVVLNPLPPPQDDLSRRRPVWDALSNLFLDTELTEKDFRWIANVLVESDYDDAQLDHVLFNEVFPVCVANLRTPAGEWAGFDLDWLQDQILRNQPRFLKVWKVLEPDRGLIESNWKRVRELTCAERTKRNQ